MSLLDRLRWMLGLLAPAAVCLLCAFILLALITLERGTTVSCLCFGATTGEIVSMRTVVRLGVLVLAEFVICLSVFSESHNPILRNLETGDLLYAILCACIVLVAVLWALSIPDVLAVQKKCRTCGARAT